MEYAKLSWYNQWVKKLEFSYYGIISMTILIGSCYGAIAAMIVLQNDAPIWQLGVCIFVAMGNNVAAIGQAPLKWVINMFGLCMLISTLLILINVF